MKSSVAAFALLRVLFDAAAGEAASFTVTTNDSGGAGSLRQAILDANKTEEADVVLFSIPGDKVHVIAGELPPVTEALTISGYSQPGSSFNTSENETNAGIRIQLHGGELEDAAAVLRVEKSSLNVEGVSITGIPAKGFGVQVGPAASAVIGGCFLGVEPDGETVSSKGSGIFLEGTASVGGFTLASRNLLSGNAVAGILIQGDDSEIQNNLIGTTPSGEPGLGNGVGIRLLEGASGNVIAALHPNVIAGNEEEGILLDASAGSGNRIAANEVFANGALGIDLGGDGVTPNDANDADGGPNGLQNAPELWAARTNLAKLHVDFFLEAVPGDYEIRFFASTNADASGFGEGAQPIGSTTVVVPADGEANFVFDDQLAGLPGTALVITATAERLETGDTSEFSNAIEAPVANSEILVTNAQNSGVGSLRLAVLAANADPDLDTILFAIPGAGPHTITLEAGITVSAPLVIDGYTQAGAEPNDLAEGSNADIRIVIDGEAVDDDAALLLDAPTVLRGVAIVHTHNNAVRIFDSTGSRLEGSFIGVAADGTTGAGGARDGVAILQSNDTVIGGSARAQRNLVSANEGVGIFDDSFDTVIRNNIIGGDRNGAPTLGNEKSGIQLDAGRGVVGSDDPALGNRIVGNGEAGILASFESFGSAILGNSIADNGTLGIELLGSEVDAGGVTPNDVDDADNDLQNFPVISAVEAGFEATTVTGSLDIPPGRVGTSGYELRFFASAPCDESGNGEGERFLGAESVVFAADQAFEVELTAPFLAGSAITATALDTKGDGSSEFSACFELDAALCGDASLNEDLAAGDALIVLKAAVGSFDCPLCVCDVNGSGGIVSSDALQTLRAAVGQSVVLSCPACL